MERAVARVVTSLFCSGNLVTIRQPIVGVINSRILWGEKEGEIDENGGGTLMHGEVGLVVTMKILSRYDYVMVISPRGEVGWIWNRFVEIID